MEFIDNEVERVKALKRYDILDTPLDGSYQRIVALASKMFNMPIALISLVDQDRIWFKAKHGLDGVAQINRDPGLCASAILSKDLYLIENAIEDPRCMTNPLVCGEFGLRFYAAAPLRTQEGYNLGTLCIIDRAQRYINNQQKEMLEDLAQIVVDEMELRLAAINTVNKYKKRITELEKEKQDLVK